MHDYYDDTGLTSRAWFKPLVALWFGALAAAGMWFMPPDVHASIVRMSGLANVHPIFAEPIGRSAVIALCVGVAVLGALIGFLIAWRISAANRPRGFAPGFELHEEDGWLDDEVYEEPKRRRVFSAREDIGEEGIAISAPTEEDGHEGDYEDEYTIEDIPQVSPEDDFETVYAEMDADYIPAEDVSEPEVIETEVESPADYADFEEVEEPPREPVRAPLPETIVEAGPEPAAQVDSQPLGDMSLDALVGRLGSALDQHRRLVAGSEDAAREPAPSPIPMTRQPEIDDEPVEEGLPEASDDDPVIAFLRREASRRMPEGRQPDSAADEQSEEATRPAASQTDAQAALRSALDRLGQANRGDS